MAASTSKELADALKQSKRGDTPTPDAVATVLIDLASKILPAPSSSTESGESAPAEASKPVDWKLLKELTAGLLNARFTLNSADAIFEVLRQVLVVATHEIIVAGSSIHTHSNNNNNSSGKTASFTAALEILALLLDSRGQQFFRHHGIPLSLGDAARQRVQQHQQQQHVQQQKGDQETIPPPFPSAVAVGDRLEAWHERVRAWVPVVVSEVNQHGACKLNWQQQLTPSSSSSSSYPPPPSNGTGWYSRGDPTLRSPRSSSTSISRDGAVEQQWRLDLNFDDVIDALEGGNAGRWTTAKVVDFIFSTDAAATAAPDSSSSFTATALMDAWQKEMEAEENKKKQEALEATVFAGDSSLELEGLPPLEAVSLAAEEEIPALVPATATADDAPLPPVSSSAPEPAPATAAAATATTTQTPSEAASLPPVSFPPLPPGWKELSFSERRKSLRFVFCPSLSVTKVRLAIENSGGTTAYGGYSISSGTTFEWLDLSSLRMAPKGMHCCGKVSFGIGQGADSSADKGWDRDRDETLIAMRSIFDAEDASLPPPDFSSSRSSFFSGGGGSEDIVVNRYGPTLFSSARLFDLLKRFADAGGFDVLLRQLLASAGLEAAIVIDAIGQSWELKISPSSSFSSPLHPSSSSSLPITPLSLLHILAVLEAATPFFSRDYATKLVAPIARDAPFRILLSMRSAELRSLTPDHLRSLGTRVTRLVAGRINDARPLPLMDVIRVLEQASLDLAMSLLQPETPIAQQITGMKMLLEAVQAVRMNRSGVISSESVVFWLRQSRLLEQIFLGRAMALAVPQEVIARSAAAASAFAVNIPTSATSEVVALPLYPSALNQAPACFKCGWSEGFVFSPLSSPLIGSNGEPLASATQWVSAFKATSNASSTPSAASNNTGGSALMPTLMLRPAHPELVRRTSEILKLLFAAKANTTGDLDLIWLAVRAEDEEVSSAAFKVLEDCSWWMNKDDIASVMSRMIVLPPEDISSRPILDAVKRFATTGQHGAAMGPLALEVFWRMAGPGDQSLGLLSIVQPAETAESTSEDSQPEASPKAKSPSYAEVASSGGGAAAAVWSSTVSNAGSKNIDDNSTESAAATTPSSTANSTASAASAVTTALTALGPTAGLAAKGRNPFSDAIRNEAETRLRDVLLSYHNRDRRLPFLKRLVGTIEAAAAAAMAAEDSAGQSSSSLSPYLLSGEIPRLLSLVWAMIDSYFDGTVYAGSLNRGQVMAELEGETGRLTSAIVSEICCYKQAAMIAAARAGLVANSSNDALASFTPFGALTAAEGGAGSTGLQSLRHIAHLQERIFFLRRLLTTAGSRRLSFPQLDALFQALYQDALCAAERSLILDFLSVGVSVNAGGSFWDHATSKRFFFERILPSDLAESEADASSMTSNGFTVFRSFFFEVHARTGAIIRHNDSECEPTVDPSSLAGVDHLWRIALKTRDEGVAVNASTFLTELHTRLSEDGLMLYRVLHASDSEKDKKEADGSSTSSSSSLSPALAKAVAAAGQHVLPFQEATKIKRALQKSVMTSYCARCLDELSQAAASLDTNNSASVTACRRALMLFTKLMESNDAKGYGLVLRPHAGRTRGFAIRVKVKNELPPITAAPPLPPPLPSAPPATPAPPAADAPSDNADKTAAAAADVAATAVINATLPKKESAAPPSTSVVAVPADSPPFPATLPSSFGLTFYAQSTVWEMKTAIAARVGIPPDWLRLSLSVSNNTGTASSPVALPSNAHGRVLSSFGVGPASEVTVCVALASLLADGQGTITAQEWKRARLNPLAERAVRVIFRRFVRQQEELGIGLGLGLGLDVDAAGPMGMTVKGMVNLFAACGIPANPGEENRVAGFFSSHETFCLPGGSTGSNGSNGPNTTKVLSELGFVNFYREAAVARPAAVMKDFFCQGFDEGFHFVGLPKASRSWYEQEAWHAAKCAPAALLSAAAKDGLPYAHSVLLSLLRTKADAPAEANWAVAQVVTSAWSLLQRLPTDPSLLESLSFGIPLFRREAQLARILATLEPASSPSSSSSSLTLAAIEEPSATAVESFFREPSTGGASTKSAAPLSGFPLLYLLQTIESFSRPEGAAAPSSSSSSSSSSATAGSRGGKAGSDDKAESGGGGGDGEDDEPAAAATTTAAPAAPSAGSTAADDSGAPSSPALVHAGASVLIPPTLNLDGTSLLSAGGQGPVGDAAMEAPAPTSPTASRSTAATNTEPASSSLSGGLITPAQLVAMPKALRTSAEQLVSAAASEWRSRFVRSGGFSHLVAVLIGADGNDTNTNGSATTAAVESSRFAAVSQATRLVKIFLMPALSLSHSSHAPSPSPSPLPSTSTSTSAVAASALATSQEALKAVDIDGLQRALLRVTFEAASTTATGSTTMTDADDDSSKATISEFLDAWLAVSLHRPARVVAELSRARDEAEKELVKQGMLAAPPVERSDTRSTDRSDDASSSSSSIDRLVTSLLLCPTSLRMRQLASSVLLRLVNGLPTSCAGKEAILMILLRHLNEIRNEDAAPSLSPCGEFFILLNRLLRDVTGITAARDKIKQAKLEAARKAKGLMLTAILGSGSSSSSSSSVGGAAGSNAGAGSDGVGRKDASFFLPLLRHLTARILAHEGLEAAVHSKLYGLPSGVSVTLTLAEGGETSSSSKSAATAVAPQEDDELLIGLLQAMTTLLEAYPGRLKDQLSTSRVDLVAQIFDTLLFRLPGGGEGGGAQHDPTKTAPKCARPRARAAAYKALVKLCEGGSGSGSGGAGAGSGAGAGAANIEVKNSLGGLSASLKSLVAATSRPVGFRNAITKTTRNTEIGYVGLRNLGCICYMNSMLQQLYAIPLFRYGILQAPSASPSATTVTTAGANEADTDDVLYQLQRMFSFLALSDRQDYNPRPWCFAFKDLSGNPTPIAVQQDANEFATSFFERIEKLLAGGSQAKLLDNTCKGQLVYQKRCTRCGTTTSTPDDFFMLKLEVKSKLEESLADWSKEEQIEGVFCDACADKATAGRRAMVGRAPPVLILHLNRLVFNFETFLREKNNSRMAFPLQLDMSAFVASSSSSSSASEGEGGGGGGGGGESAEQQQQSPPPLASPSNETASTSIAAVPTAAASSIDHQYRLVGVLVHSGHAEAGHYFSYLEDRSTGVWAEVNDSHVRPFNLSADLERACFGGMQEHVEVSTYGGVYTTKKEATENAYLLFYERSSSSSSPSDGSGNGTTGSSGANSPSGSGSSPTAADPASASASATIDISISPLAPAVDLARVAAGLPPRLSAPAPVAVAAASPSSSAAAANEGEKGGEKSFQEWLRAKAWEISSACLPSSRFDSDPTAAAAAKKPYCYPASAEVWRAVVPPSFYRLVASDNVNFARDRGVHAPDFSSFLSDILTALSSGATTTTTTSSSNSRLSVPYDEASYVSSILQSVSSAASAVDVAVDFMLGILARTDKAGPVFTSMASSIVKIMKAAKKDQLASLRGKMAGPLVTSSLDSSANSEEERQEIYAARLQASTAIEVSKRLLRRLTNSKEDPSSLSNLAEVLLACPEDRVRGALAEMITAAIMTLCSTAVEQHRLREALREAGILKKDALLPSSSSSSAQPQPSQSLVIGSLKALLSPLVLPEVFKNWPRFKDFFSILATVADPVLFGFDVLVPGKHYFSLPLTSSGKEEDKEKEKEKEEEAVTHDQGYTVFQPLSLFLLPGIRHVIVKALDMLLGPEASPLAAAALNGIALPSSSSSDADADAAAVPPSSSTAIVKASQDEVKKLYPVPTIGSTSTTPPWQEAIKLIVLFARAMDVHGFPFSSNVGNSAGSSASGDSTTAAIDSLAANPRWGKDAVAPYAALLYDFRAVTASLPSLADGSIKEPLDAKMKGRVLFEPSALRLTQEEESLLSAPDFWVRSLAASFSGSTVITGTSLSSLACHLLWCNPAANPFVAHILCLGLSASSLEPSGVQEFMPLLEAITVRLNDWVVVAAPKGEEEKVIPWPQEWLLSSSSSSPSSSSSCAESPQPTGTTVANWGTLRVLQRLSCFFGDPHFGSSLAGVGLGLPALIAAAASSSSSSLDKPGASLPLPFSALWVATKGPEAVLATEIDYSSKDSNEGGARTTNATSTTTTSSRVKRKRKGKLTGLKKVKIGGTSVELDGPSSAANSNKNKKKGGADSDGTHRRKRGGSTSAVSGAKTEDADALLAHSLGGGGDSDDIDAETLALIAKLEREEAAAAAAAAAASPSPPSAPPSATATYGPPTQQQAEAIRNGAPVTVSDDDDAMDAETRHALEAVAAMEELERSQQQQQQEDSSGIVDAGKEMSVEEAGALAASLSAIHQEAKGGLEATKAVAVGVGNAEESADEDDGDDGSDAGSDAGSTDGEGQEAATGTEHANASSASTSTIPIPAARPAVRSLALDHASALLSTFDGRMRFLSSVCSLRAGSGLLRLMQRRRNSAEAAVYKLLTELVRFAEGCPLLHWYLWRLPAFEPDSSGFHGRYVDAWRRTVVREADLASVPFVATTTTTINTTATTATAAEAAGGGGGVPVAIPVGERQVAAFVVRPTNPSASVVGNQGSSPYGNAAFTLPYGDKSQKIEQALELLARLKRLDTMYQDAASALDSSPSSITTTVLEAFKPTPLPPLFANPATNNALLQKDTCDDPYSYYGYVAPGTKPVLEEGLIKPFAPLDATEKARSDALMRGVSLSDPILMRAIKAGLVRSPTSDAGFQVVAVIYQHPYSYSSSSSSSSSSFASPPAQQQPCLHDNGSIHPLPLPSSRQCGHWHLAVVARSTKDSDVTFTLKNVIMPKHPDDDEPEPEPEPATEGQAAVDTAAPVAIPVPVAEAVVVDEGATAAVPLATEVTTPAADADAATAVPLAAPAPLAPAPKPKATKNDATPLCQRRAVDVNIVPNPRPLTRVIKAKETCLLFDAPLFDNDKKTVSGDPFVGFHYSWVFQLLPKESIDRNNGEVPGSAAVTFNNNNYAIVAGAGGPVGALVAAAKAKDGSSADAGVGGGGNKKKGGAGAGSSSNASKKAGLTDDWRVALAAASDRSSASSSNPAMTDDGCLVGNFFADTDDDSSKDYSSLAVVPVGPTLSVDDDQQQDYDNDSGGSVITAVPPVVTDKIEWQQNRGNSSSASKSNNTNSNSNSSKKKNVTIAGIPLAMSMDAEWACQACTFLNAGSSTSCEICQTAKGAAFEA